MASIRRVLSSSTNGALSSRNLKAICSRLPDRLKEFSLIKGNISTSTYTLKVLDQSTLLIQDGTSFQELPVLIRRADRESFPFTSHSYTGENIREVSQFETSFKQVLQDCATVSDVFKLLEVPPDKVEGYSAAFALQRLHALMYLNTEWLQIHSFIRTAVMRELYETVQRDVQLISNSALINLVECYLAAQGFSPNCVHAINDEISDRLVAGVFSMEELLCLIQSLSTASSRSTENIYPSYKNHPSLSEILFENASKFLSSPPQDKPEHFDKFTAKASPETREKINQKCAELMRNAWVHLATRYHELNENSLPLTLQLLPLEKKNVVPLLEKPLSKIWYHLSAEGSSVCLDNLLRLRTHNSTMMAYLGQWAYVNIHLVTPSLLLSFLNVYIRFKHLDRNTIGVMERCLKKSGQDTPTDLLALCVEYLRSFNFVSPIIMDMAAEHFTLHWTSYTPLEIYAVLRAFGHLRYLPSQSHCQGFLKESEKCLHKRFDLLEEAHLMEVLASFTFIDVLPKNFYRRVTSNYFFKKIGDLPKLSKVQAHIWLKAMQHAVVLASSTNKDINREWVLSQKSRSVFYLLESERVAIQSLRSGLDDLFGTNFHHFIPFYSCCALYVDDKGIPLEIVKDEKGIPTSKGDVSQRLVLVLRTAAHYTTNTKKLLGAQAQKKAHLKQLGFNALEIHVPELNCLQSATVLQSHLSTHVNFNLPEVKHLMGERKRQQEQETFSWSYSFDEEEAVAEDYFSGEEDVDTVLQDPSLTVGNTWELPSTTENENKGFYNDNDPDL